MKHRIPLIGIICMLAFISCQENVAKRQSRRAARISNRKIKARLDWLVKSPSLYDQLEVNKMGIALYADSVSMVEGLVECRIYPDEYELTQALIQSLSPDSMLSLYQRKGAGRWEQLIEPVFPPSRPTPVIAETAPLSGWKIAIDPGHISGDLESAEMEGKYVKMKASELTKGQEIGFFEPELTLATAYLIQDSLQKMGAETLITRPYAGKSVRGKSFELWLTEDWDSVRNQLAMDFDWDEDAINYWRNEAPQKEIFKKMYNAEDLRVRAEKVNDFRPDLSLIIHYNIHSPNWDNRDDEGFFVPTEANYCMVFIPGSFAKGELRDPEDRLNFLRLLLTDDLEKSYDLAAAFMENSMKHTKVPPVPESFHLPYLDHYSILTDVDGLYARNLSLTRNVWGPLIYGESLCQDNVREALSLNVPNRNIGEIFYPSRLEDVAMAYIASVLDYVSRHKKKPSL